MTLTIILQNLESFRIFDFKSETSEGSAHLNYFLTNLKDIPSKNHTLKQKKTKVATHYLGSEQLRH